ncbi:MAG: SLBB domain-containing protein [Verrucomicrobiales bacterium]
MVAAVSTIYLVAQDTVEPSDTEQTASKEPQAAVDQTSAASGEQSTEKSGEAAATVSGETDANGARTEGLADETNAGGAPTGGLLPETSIGSQNQTSAADELAVLDPPLKDHPGSVAGEGDEQKAGYRLGVGDVIGVKYHGRKEFDRGGIQIAPDGTISYLETKQVKVAGLTIPEVRSELEKRLGEVHENAPRLIVFPQFLGSERFTILGMVKRNGSHPLNKRIRLLEALALSGGVTATEGVAGPELAADFSRSFLVRGGEKQNIDFEKLYVQGDLEQNVLVQDGDYIYIGSNAQNRCYVLGAVNGNRSVTISPGASVMSVIASAGGYTDDAWRGKVLLIRGSLSMPEVSVVDSADILKGKAVDVDVQPGDIVYVHNRPFRRTTRLVDTAIKALIRGAIAGAIDDQNGVGI